MKKVRLGFNIDHVATIRNARGGPHPDPLRAAQEAISAGADGITMHLREDRRHIRDEDVARVRAAISAPLNLEMAVTDEMLGIALKTRPHAVCLVPEKRQEVTTEGGLDAAGMAGTLKPFVARLSEAGIRVSLFIDPEEAQVDAAALIGAPVVELHTGTYAEKDGAAGELARLAAAAERAAQAGIECHAGHGLTFENVTPVAALAPVAELNIGHYLVGEAVFSGLPFVIAHMKELIARARQP
ncbi:pyridoxine 5'-phosphate synthase [Mesorhizobium australicum]|uniref:Pyridoxine 5'-phosphate synthase n=1 Tax=Mesorhizobium australicum TaxID=536018 RepID=A0A1X7MQE4_9HYPH|nr:pyridoxine 5'-phosphate synthase [Mesorhizobium australicum]SMH26193.1 pyridoxine 5'-phosphate synthase [Mesorhizobium australicum]